MKKTFLIAILSLSLAGNFALAQTMASSQTSGTASISGDSVCGGASADPNNPAANECGLNNLKTIGKSALANAALILGIVAIVVISIWVILGVKARIEGKPYAIKSTTTKIENVLFGFLLIFIAGATLITILKTLGVQDQFLTIWKTLFSMSGLVDHAYAETLLPNPYGAKVNAVDIIISGANLIMRFFVYPALIALIVWSGLKFITSQGKPEGLKEAKAWLWWSIIAVLIVFSLQGFIMAFQATINEIAPVTRSDSSSVPDASAVQAFQAKQASALQAFNTCIQNGGVQSSCQQQFQQAGGIGSGQQAVAQQAYNTCIGNGNSASECQAAYQAYGGTGSAQQNLAQEAYNTCIGNGNSVSECQAAYQAYGGTGSGASGLGQQAYDTCMQNGGSATQCNAARDAYTGANSNCDSLSSEAQRNACYANNGVTSDTTATSNATSNATTDTSTTDTSASADTSASTDTSTTDTSSMDTTSDQ